MEYFDLAAKLALPDDKRDMRAYWLAAIGIRARDGVIVSAKNLACQSSVRVEDFRMIPGSHAESRCVAKMGKSGGILYVVRVRRKDKNFGRSKPCSMCRTIIRSHNIDQVYYTIDANHYGIWNLSKDTEDRVVEF